jgi:hypothetical protein
MRNPGEGGPPEVGTEKIVDKTDQRNPRHCKNFGEPGSAPAFARFTSLYLRPSFTLPGPPFAGKCMDSPENRVSIPREDPTLSSGRQATARELGMARTQNSKRNFSSLLGTAMLIVGSATLATYAAALAWQFHAALGSSADSLGFFGNIGLACLHAARLVMLDHAVLLSVVHRILVLCSALIVTLIGIALLRKRTAGVNTPGTRDLPAPPRRDQ